MSSLENGVQVTWVTFVDADGEKVGVVQQLVTVPRNSEYVVIEGQRYVVSGAEWDLDGTAPAVEVWLVPR